MANAQGNAFRQQGGQAPVGEQGLLEGGLRSSAGLDSLDASSSEIKGMQDGGRRRKSRSAKRSTKRKASRSTKRKASRKGRKNRSAKRKASRKGRKSTRRQRGGAFGDAAQEVSAPTTLLPADMQKVALGTQSDEWRLAANPNTFKPT